jgi:acid phosphatase
MAARALSATIALVLAGALVGCEAPRSPAGVTATPLTGSPPGPTASAQPSGPTASAQRSGWPAHIMVVVLENKASAQIDGNPDAPYLNSLLASSAVLTEARAVAHPSQPNYIALFSGSTQGVTSDQCPLALGDRPNLGRQLLDAGLSFTGYSEGLPEPGFTGCSSGRYAAKHNPWINFSNLPGTVNQPAGALPPDYSTLPTVSFLIPDLCHDMHDCPIATGDSWMRDHVDSYARWARDNKSLLVVTFDEDDNASDNRILTLVSGAGVRPGRYAQPVDHYGVLGTIEDLYGLPRLGSATTATPIAEIWN